MRMPPSKAKIWAWRLSILVLMLILWECWGRYSPKTAFFAGTPSQIASEFHDLLVNGKLYWHFLVTGGEAILGLAMGMTVGTALGLSLWYSRMAGEVLRPFFLAVGSLPILAIAPLMIVWFGVGFSMKVALACLSTVFVAFSQAHRGASSVSKDYTEMAIGFGASGNQVFFKVVLPASCDWVFASMRLNVGFSLLGAFIGEFISSSQGLGHVVLRAASLYNVPRALAASLGITLLACIFDRLASYIEAHRDRLMQLASVPHTLLFSK